MVNGALEVNETRLHKELFKGYNKHAHPRLPGTGPVVVTFDFQLIRILDVVSVFFCLHSCGRVAASDDNFSEFVLGDDPILIINSKQKTFMKNPGICQGEEWGRDL